MTPDQALEELVQMFQLGLIGPNCSVVDDDALAHGQGSVTGRSARNTAQGACQDAASAN
jgi:hypothetical protein